MCKCLLFVQNLHKFKSVKINNHEKTGIRTYFCVFLLEQCFCLFTMPYYTPVSLPFYVYDISFKFYNTYPTCAKAFFVHTCHTCDETSSFLTSMPLKREERLLWLCITGCCRVGSSYHLCNVFGMSRSGPEPHEQQVVGSIPNRVIPKTL